MDFITGLPPSEGCTALTVVTDRLSKDVVLIPLSSLDTELVARKFIERVVSYH
jgi:transposase InsO family protein